MHLSAKCKCVVLPMLCAVLGVFSGNGSAQTTASKEAEPLYLKGNSPVEARVADLLDRMSLEEKARQLTAISIPPELPDLRAASSSGPTDPPFWATSGAGVVGWSANRPTKEILDGVKKGSRLGIPPLVLNMALPESGDDPALVNLSATWDVELSRQAASAVAGRQRVLGINAVLLPLFRFAGNAQMARGFSENTFLVGRMGRAYAQGLQGDMAHREEAVAAFPAYFATIGVQDQRSQAGERELRMNLLKPFAAVLDEGNTLGVIAASGEIDGVPTVANAKLMKNILRGEWQFKGMVLAAPGSIRDLSEKLHATANSADAVCLAMNAGVDMQWNDYTGEMPTSAIVKCVQGGVISMEALNRAVANVLRVKFQLGLFDDSHPLVQALAKDTAAKPEISLQAAAESLTLLRNEHNLLPLSRDLKSIFVIEPSAADSDAKKMAAPQVADTLFDEIKRLLPQAEVASSDGNDVTAAAAQAKKAGAVVVVLNGRLANSSGAKDPEQTLKAQEKLLTAILAANDKTIVVFEDTNFEALKWPAGHVPAMIEAWSREKFTARAVAEALFGVNNPAGRTPLAIYANVEAQNPRRDHASDTDAGKALFPLGFGLSYTEFRYSNLKVHLPEPSSKDDVDVTFTITNAGKVDGDEVVQLYLHHEVSSVLTPDRTLQGFERIHLRAGESRELSFKIRQSELAVWNAKEQWSVEPGPYTIFAGGSSMAQLSESFSIGQPSWARTLAADSDHWIPAPALETRGDQRADFSEAYQLALRVMEYNIHQGLLEAGEGYGIWTRDSSINSWNAASLLIPEVAKRTLWRAIELTGDGPVIGGQYWDKVIWILAARQYAAITGDQPFLKSAYDVALRTLAAMRASQYDEQAGLFHGPAVYGDGVAAYPDPPFNDTHGDNILDYSQAAELEVLSTNSVYYGAYRAAAAMGRQLGAAQQETAGLDEQASALRKAIQSTLWMANENRFAYFRDGQGRIDGTQEALGEAFAVSLGVASEQQAHAIFRHANVTPWGVACTWKPYDRYLDPTGKVFGRHNGTIWPFINAFWATAAASTGEPGVFAKEFLLATQLALRSEDFREIYHPYTGDPYGGFQINKTWDSVRHQTWSATGYLRMVYAGLFGMRFEEEGIRLQPTVPASLGLHSIALRGLLYQKAELNITVRGTGSKILRCTIDGVLQPNAFVPSTLTGRHDIEIRLAAEAPSAQKRAVVASPSNQVHSRLN